MILRDIQYKHYRYYCRDIKYGQFGTEPTYYTLYTCSQGSTHIYKFYLHGILHEDGVFYTYDTHVIFAKV